MCEMRKILYSNHASEEMVEQFIAQRKRIKSRRYTRESREREKRQIETLMIKKERLILERERLRGEINVYGSKVRTN